MIFGRIAITETAVQTHKDSYLIDRLSVVSVHRPALITGLLFAIGGTAFGLRFADLLYPHEQWTIGGIVAAALILGLKLGQIRLLSRDLRGSELSGMIWGTFGHLNRIRGEIIAVMEARGLDAGIRARTGA